MLRNELNEGIVIKVVIIIEGIIFLWISLVGGSSSDFIFVIVGVNLKSIFLVDFVYFKMMGFDWSYSFISFFFW